MTQKCGRGGAGSLCRQIDALTGPEIRTGGIEGVDLLEIAIFFFFFHIDMAWIGKRVGLCTISPVTSCPFGQW